MKHQKHQKSVESSKKAVRVRCPDCPWKAGLKDEHTHCPTCEGHGFVLDNE